MNGFLLKSCFFNEISTKSHSVLKISSSLSSHNLLLPTEDVKSCPNLYTNILSKISKLY